jgi:hypothetical protein
MKQITRDRLLTPEEIAEDRRIRGEIEQEMPELIAQHHERMAAREAAATVPPAVAIPGVSVTISTTLRRYLDAYRPRIVPGGWGFPSPEGKRWDPDNFSQDLRATNDKMHLPWACLDYRHTFGSQLAMKGESLYKLSTFMGNSPEICRRHYAMLTPDSLIDTVEFLDKSAGQMRHENGSLEEQVA